jgi:hypothetical protein
MVHQYITAGRSETSSQAELPTGYSSSSLPATLHLNPNEGIWKHLKYTELKNVRCKSLAELRRAKERLRHKRYVIHCCIRQPGLRG